MGPTPEGTFTKEETQRLLEVGDWLEQYGEGIYETRARPEAWTENWHLTYSKDQKHIMPFAVSQQICSREFF